MHRNAVPLRDRFHDPVEDEYAGRLSPPPASVPDPFPGALSREATARWHEPEPEHDPLPDPEPGPERGPKPDPEFGPKPARATAPVPPALAPNPAAPPEPAPPASRPSRTSPPREVRLADRAAVLTQATGSTDARVQGWLVDDLAPVLARTAPPPPEGAHLPVSAPEDRVFAALSALSEIGPRDAMEGMLAAQMVAVHASALDCLREAAMPGLKGRDRHTELRDAARLLGVFERHLRLRDDRRNPRLARSVAGRSWNKTGARHDDDFYGCGAGWGGEYWVSAQAKPAQVRGKEDAGR